MNIILKNILFIFFSEYCLNKDYFREYYHFKYILSKK